MRSRLVLTTSILMLLYMTNGDDSFYPDEDLAHFLSVQDRYNVFDSDMDFDYLKEYAFSCQYLADLSIYDLTPLAS